MAGKPDILKFSVTQLGTTDERERNIAFLQSAIKECEQAGIKLPSELLRAAERPKQPPPSQPEVIKQ